MTDARCHVLSRVQAQRLRDRCRLASCNSGGRRRKNAACSTDVHAHVHVPGSGKRVGFRGLAEGSANEAIPRPEASPAFLPRTEFKHATAVSWSTALDRTGYRTGLRQAGIPYHRTELAIPVCALPPTAAHYHCRRNDYMCWTQNDERRPARIRGVSCARACVWWWWCWWWW